jgi:hypothetical protein
LTRLANRFQLIYEIQRIEVKKEEEIPSYAGAATDTGDRYGDLNQDRYLVTEIKIKNNSPVLVMGIFDGKL